MEVLVAPDKFAGTLTAPEVITAISDGWSRRRPGDTVTGVVLADGGPGFCDAVAAALGGNRRGVEVRGPVGGRARANLLFVGADAYLESAQACGLHLVGPEARDSGGATTVGVGEMIAAAVVMGAARIVVGLGGSATTDGGAGALAALGARAFGSDGVDATDAMRGGGAALGAVARVMLDGVRRALAGVELLVATDIDAPLLGPRGAARGYAPQKGATPEQVGGLEQALGVWARLTVAAGSAVRADAPGCGAAGGLGFGLMAVGARRVSGIELLARLVDLPRLCARADVVITGEGRLDWQSLQGKVVHGVADAARAAGTPSLVVAGQSDLAHDQWRGRGIRDVATAAEEAGGAEAALADPARWVAAAAEQLARRCDPGDPQ